MTWVMYCWILCFCIFFLILNVYLEKSLQMSSIEILKSIIKINYFSQKLCSLYLDFLHSHAVWYALFLCKFGPKKLWELYIIFCCVLINVVVTPKRSKMQVWKSVKLSISRIITLQAHCTMVVQNSCKLNPPNFVFLKLNRFN